MPGKSSFTTALVWALEKLAKDRPIFTTSELVKKICSAPDFPKKQYPILAERNAASNVRIQLSKLSKADGEPESPENPGAPGGGAGQPLNPQYLSLRFAFDTKPSDKEIAHIARALSGLIKNHTLTARRIDWGGLRPSDIVKIAAKKFLESGLRQRARRASGASLNAPLSPISPATSDGQSSDLLSPTKIPRRESRDNDEGEVERLLGAPESDKPIRSGVRKLGGDQTSFEAGRRKRRRAAARSGDPASGCVVVISEHQG